MEQDPLISALIFIVTDGRNMTGGLKRIQGPDGLFYGVEGSIENLYTLDKILLNLIKRSIAYGNVGSSGRFMALDIGGETGHCAQMWAELGADVLVTALGDCSREVFARNPINGRNALSFRQGDIRECDKTLRADYGLIQLRQVFHWMPEQDVFGVLRFLPNICSRRTFLAVSIENYPGEAGKRNAPPFHDHTFERMGSMIEKSGYKILLSLNEPKRASLSGAHLGQYLVKMPPPR